MNESNKNIYSASFTAGGLLYSEFNALLEIISRKDWKDSLAAEIRNNQYLKINSETARIRVITEIKKRIKSIDSIFYDYFMVCNEQEKKLLLFYLMLKVYPLVFSFHFDVTIENWKKGVSIIDPYVYQMKLDELSASNPDVDSWSDQTKRKVITVYIRMLTETGFIINKRLNPIQVNDQFWCYFIQNNNKWFLDTCLIPNETKKRVQNICL